jgi:hypothetical protein
VQSFVHTIKLQLEQVIKVVNLVTGAAYVLAASPASPLVLSNVAAIRLPAAAAAFDAGGSGGGSGHVGVANIMVPPPPSL